MKKPRVLVVGCGNIGLRHLEGFVKFPSELYLVLADASITALERVKKFCDANVGSGNKSIHYIVLQNEVKFGPNHFDLVVVSTTARNREKLVFALRESITADHWLLEKPVAQSPVAMRALADRIEHGSCTVNFSRRLMSLYQFSNQCLRGLGPLSVRISYPGLWIGCNIFHYIDLVHWWTDSFPSKVCTDFLDSIWQKSKRPGYYEVSGRLVIDFEDGSTLTAVSGDVESLPILIKTNDKSEFKLDEVNSTFVGNNIGEVKHAVQLQSSLSTSILEHLICGRETGLPTLQNAVDCGVLVTSALLQHWNKNMEDRLENVPLT